MFMVEYIQDQYPEPEKEEGATSEPAEGMLDLDAIYRVADEAFDLDIDMNFSDGLEFIKKLKGVTNINAANFLKRPKDGQKPGEQGDGDSEESGGDGDDEGDFEEEAGDDDLDIF
uniref:Uncharacterized protein n=1 Tax=Strombidium inclinatum TaxID=197538 RepID=A0A7S3N1N7_9SPIT|mmetsp:Transcript_39485/g.60288  ORF Transcript_39485/g.60288 Transcript_39485/m.60288 type:complete len:115 (+) Transcript_39485:303-647(+)